MHPTQHSTIKRTQPRILRTHQIITQGHALDERAAEKADQFIMQAVSGLISLSKQAASGLQIAPTSPPRGLHELLSQASHQAKAFTPRPAPMPGRGEAV